MLDEHASLMEVGIQREVVGLGRVEGGSRLCVGVKRTTVKTDLSVSKPLLPQGIASRGQPDT